MTEVLAARLTAQLLAGDPARRPVEVVQRLLAVQAQDLPAARLAVRARTTGLAASDVDRALEDRELVVSWLNRGTLHLVRSEDYPWLHTLTTPQLATSNLTRLAQEGVTPSQAERAVAVIERELADGPRSRAELRAVMESADVPVAGQALVHLLFLATLRGLCVRGPVRGTEQAFVLVRDWLPQTAAVDRETALRELARRYLIGHGPSSERDLAKWAGLSLGNARRALAGVRAPVVDAAPLPPPRLLGPFDELLMGWASRDLVLDGHEPAVIAGGMIRAIALVNGRAVGTWTRPQGHVALQPFVPLSARVVTALKRDGTDVQRFLGA